MSLIFFDEIIFLLAVVLNIMASFAQMHQHALDRPRTHAEALSRAHERPEAAFLQQFQNVVESSFVGSVIHRASNLLLA